MTTHKHTVGNEFCNSCKTFFSKINDGKFKCLTVVAIKEKLLPLERHINKIFLNF